MFKKSKPVEKKAHALYYRNQEICEAVLLTFEKQTPDATEELKNVLAF